LKIAIRRHLCLYICHGILHWICRTSTGLFLIKIFEKIFEKFFFRYDELRTPWLELLEQYPRLSYAFGAEWLISVWILCNHVHCSFASF
jgi:hypothetical protein